MSLAAAFSSAIDTLYAMFGVSASYETQREAASTVTIVITEDLSQWGADITVANDYHGITVRRSDVTDKPRRGDTFTVDSTVYCVEQVLRQPNEFEWRTLAVVN